MQRATSFGALFLLAAACGGGGKAPGAPSGPGNPVDPPAPFLSTAPGLTGAVALETSARVDLVLPSADFEAALFVGTDKATLFADPPVMDPIVGESAIVGGLVSDTDYFFGVGVRPTTVGPEGASYTPVGAVVRARTGAPIYVDAAADPIGADGVTPATAFPELLLGVLTAATGGRNVLVRAGAYPVGSLPLLDDVCVFGGFDAAFDLATRGEQQSVIVGGLTGQGMIAVLGGGEPNIVDGLRFDGGAFAAFGIDVSDADAEVRGCVIEDFVGRGIRLRNAPGEPTREVLIAGCRSSANGADGLSLSGAFRLRVEGSRFDSNAQEGLDCDDLVANDNDVAELHIRGSGFFGNGAQGLDADFAAPAVIGPFGGVFDVRVENCTFDLNGEEGLLLDQDHEGIPGWRADIFVSGVRARANGREGVRIDADAESTVNVHRSALVGNGTDGVWISSESSPGLAVVSACALVGNQGAGVRASLGNKVVAASHCVFTFNAGGGMVSELVDSSASSCVFYLQPSPWTGVVAEAEVVVAGAFPTPFANAPEALAFATAESGGVLTLDGDPGAMVGMSAELADDDIERTVTAAGGASLTVDPAPEVFLTPGAVALFGIGASVVEDWSPSVGSVLLDAGMAPPAGPFADAGPLGAGAGGAPGVVDPGEPEPFRVVETTPHSSVGIAPTEDLLISFAGGALDPATLAVDSVRVLNQAGTVPVVLLLDGADVRVSPVSTWGTGPLLVEVHGVLAAVDGRPLAASVAIPVGTD